MLPFAETVLAWRLARGMTQAELARAARVPRPNLSAIERGEREVTLRTLRALAVALDVTPGTLADGISPRAGSTPLPRAALERIAGAALGGRPPSDAREAELAKQLRAVTAAWSAGGRDPRARRRAGAAERRRPRAVERAYFFLKIAETPETVASLMSRVADRLGRA